MTPILWCLVGAAALGCVFGFGVWIGLRLNADRLLDARLAQELACDALPARVAARTAGSHRRRAAREAKGQTA